MTAPVWPLSSGASASDPMSGRVDGLKRGALLVAERSRFVIPLRNGSFPRLRCRQACRTALPGLGADLGADRFAGKVTATPASIHGRFVGTLIGVAVALLVNSIGRMIALPLVFQIGVGVALCATAAVGRPGIQVCLWTCPLVLVTAASGSAPVLVALMRGSEVVLGAIVGGLTHIVEERIERSARAHVLGRFGVDH